MYLERVMFEGIHTLLYLLKYGHRLVIKDGYSFKNWVIKSENDKYL